MIESRVTLNLSLEEADQLLQVVGVEIARTERFALTIVPAARSQCEHHHLKPLRALHARLTVSIEEAE